MRKAWCGAVLFLIMILSYGVVLAGSDKSVVKKKGNGREKLAVLDLEAKWGVEQDFAEGLSVLVRDEIHRFGKYEVMSREDIAAVASREAMLQAMGCDEGGTCLVDFGRTLGTRFMVAGSVSKFGTTYSISLRLLDTSGKNAGVVNRVSGSCKCSVDDFIETVHRVAGKLVGHDEAAAAAKKAREMQRQKAEAEKAKLATENKRLQEEKERAAAESVRLATKRKKRKIAAASQKNTKKYSGSITDMKFVRVKKGCFQMGSSSSEKDRGSDEGPQHRICVAGFFMSKYEVTVGQWREFMRSSEYRTEAERDVMKEGCYSFKGGKWGYYNGRYWDNVGFSQEDSQPVVCVSYDDVEEFIGWLKRKNGEGYRLPTEAEWEYAARGGNPGSRSWGEFWGNSESLACKYANVYDLNSKRKYRFGWKNHDCDDGYASTSPVGSFSPNDFGLYDMLGNVWEWTGDWYSKGYYNYSLRNNPQGAHSGSYRVVRGGGWNSSPAYVRSANRGSGNLWKRASSVGFRLVLSPRAVE